jgi:hypothetical protein
MPGPYADVCRGGKVDFLGFCNARYEQVRCYLQSDSESACLPATDPLVLSQTQPFIFSSGFVGEFVIEAADQGPLSESCNAVIACCDQDDDARVKACVARELDGSTAETRAARCEQSLESSPACRTAAEEASSRAAHSACCYHICGALKST